MRTAELSQSMLLSASSAGPRERLTGEKVVVLSRRSVELQILGETNEGGKSEV
jgi:hypothetical protein